jgi:hypothetical protein
VTDGPNKTVLNERAKLTASLLNGVAIASVVAGVVTPLAALTIGLGTISGRHPLAATVLSLAWLAVAGILHFLARRALGGLRE